MKYLNRDQTKRNWKACPLTSPFCLFTLDCGIIYVGVILPCIRRTILLKIKGVVIDNQVAWKISQRQNKITNILLTIWFTFPFLPAVHYKWNNDFIKIDTICIHTYVHMYICAYIHWRHAAEMLPGFERSDFEILLLFLLELIYIILWKFLSHIQSISDRC